MKKLTKMAGITLLEVMLVLAVAALIIVMSIRFYNSAIANNEVNGALEMGQAIISSADGFAAGTGDLTTATQANIQSTLPNNKLTLPWPSQSVVIANTATSVSITYSATPAAVCGALSARIAAGNPKVTCSPACAAAAPTALICVYTP